LSCALFALACSVSHAPGSSPTGGKGRDGGTGGDASSTSNAGTSGQTTGTGAADAGRADGGRADSGGIDAGGGGSDGGSGTTSGHANIIFILTDDLAWNLVKYMPNVKKMQQAGVTFTNYFVTDSLCCPSRTSMFTGKYPHNSGVFTNSGDDGGYATYLRLGNDPETFAVTLHESGYRTAMLGKFLNGYDPNMNEAAMGWSEWDVAGQGYPEFNYDLNQNGKVMHYGMTDADYLTDVLSRIAQGFVGGTSIDPFLIEVATFAPHAPYVPAPRHKNLFPKLTYPQTPAFNARPSASDPAWLQALPALTAKQITNIDTIFRKRAQAVQAVDEMIGKLQDLLTSSGHNKDTYVFFASDNGYHMGERSQLPGKQTAFDTDIRVPLIVTGPGVPAGITLKQIVQNIDLCPTFSELAQTPAPQTVNGRSLAPLLHGEAVSDWRNAALVEHHDAKYDPNDPDADTGVTKKPPTYNALRTAEAVYVEYVTNETEFHDHKTDPDELTNTASMLSAKQVAKYHAAIAAISTCKTSAECWKAQHF
jgi:arylsulfatase A-like enzyme